MAVFLSCCMMVPIPSLKMDYSKVLFSKDGHLLSAKIASDQQWRFPIEKDLPEMLEQSIVHFEDEYFYNHFGVNPISLCKAFYQNWKAKKIVRGGSTITMQLMRMYRGNQSRSYSQKLIELFGAIKLELLYSKEDILKMWASTAPFGGNTVGASTASWRYFNRPLEHLSIAEYATLAVLPNSPSKIHMEKNVIRLTEKRNQLLEKLHSRNLIDKTDLELAKVEDIFFNKESIPTHSIHLLEFFSKSFPDQNIFHSTIDMQLQKITKDLLQEQSNIYQFDGINNAAAIVIDHQNNELVSYIGNTNSKDLSLKYVDCAQAPRSYGSLLKPFLYSYAIEQGYFLPNELIKDIPTNINGFTPKNFDRRFRGVVPMDLMVSQSLNVPAVRVLNYVGVESFHDLLRHDLNLSHINPDFNHHGLSIILGGAEASLWQMANCYKGLARNYNAQTSPFNNLSCLLNEDHEDNENFAFQPITVQHTIEAMQSLNRPKEEQHFTKFSGNNIAWKTGTSYGHRDAWSIGINGRYVVAIWVGNEDGAGVFNLTGGQKAAPILFKIFRHLESGGDLFPPIQNTQQLEVCTKSGRLKGKYCTHTTLLDLASNHHQLRNCDYHQKHKVDNASDTIFVLNPTEKYYAEEFGNRFFLEDSNTSDLNHESKQLEIVYPQPNSVLLIPKKLENSYAEVELRASSLNPNDTLYWFINNQFVNTSFAPHKIYADLNDGPHQIHVNDVLGNESRLDFEVVRR